MNLQIVIEVCVDSVASAVAAERGGASRIELCSDLLEGGITPSAGLIGAVRSKVSVPLHVMIRPRGGDFFYDGDEVDTMCRDIQTAKELKADGVVFGVLDSAGRINVDCTRRLLEGARPLTVTFHRAFDMSADLFRSLEEVCASGVHRILTSGGEQTCMNGADTIASLVTAARDRIAVMAGSGVSPANAASIIKRTGVREIHAGLRSTVPGRMVYRNPRVTMGKVPDSDYSRSLVWKKVFVRCEPQFLLFRDSATRNAEGAASRRRASAVLHSIIY